MGRGEPIAVLVVKETYKQTWHSNPQATSVSVIVSSQLCLHSLPKFARDDPSVLTGINLPAMLDLA
jgi:hypothetical protein